MAYLCSQHKIRSWLLMASFLSHPYHSCCRPYPHSSKYNHRRTRSKNSCTQKLSIEPWLQILVYNSSWLAFDWWYSEDFWEGGDEASKTFISDALRQQFYFLCMAVERSLLHSPHEPLFITFAHSLLLLIETIVCWNLWFWKYASACCLESRWQWTLYSVGAANQMVCICDMENIYKVSLISIPFGRMILMCVVAAAWSQENSYGGFLRSPWVCFSSPSIPGLIMLSSPHK